MNLVNIIYTGTDITLSGYEGDYILRYGYVCKVEDWMADILANKGYVKTESLSSTVLEEKKRGEQQWKLESF